MFRLTGTQISAVLLMLALLGVAYTAGTITAPGSQQAMQAAIAKLDSRMERIEQGNAAIMQQIFEVGFKGAANDRRIEALEQRIERMGRRSQYPPMEYPYTPVPTDDGPAPHPVLPVLRDEQKRREL